MGHDRPGCALPPSVTSTSSRTILLSALASGAVSLAIVGTAIRFGDLSPLSMSTPAQGAPHENVPTGAREQTIIDTVLRAEPAVVSVIIAKNLPVLERYYDESPTGNPLLDDFFEFRVPRTRQNGTQLREIGGGTAFFLSSDGLLMTNRHVVDDESAQYSVLLNDGRTLEAKVLARDPVNDIALLKVEGKDFPFVKLSLQKEPVLGQTVIAIGNALGEFRNTVSVGVISGLQRSITAGNPALGEVEQLNRIIQTDAAINEGNSGGPLVASDGTVIGMSTAVAQGAQNIGFAIPVQDLQRALGSYQKYGRIVQPYIGIRYAPITPGLAKESGLNVQEGAIVVSGESAEEVAVAPGSPADKAGIRENDIILEINGEALNAHTSVADVIQGKLPGDTVRLKILRAGKEQIVPVILNEWRD